ncbi:MAG: arsenite methyltransferase [Bacteroidetes bacterium]|nr:arsenite methyltransferase [Bacteroidota bacterium]
MNSEDLKLVVQQHYGDIAVASNKEQSCCGPTSCCSPTADIAFNDNYEKLAGYNPDADLALGCGIPTEFAQIKAGDTVLDLGSGAGNDAFVARSLVGETGKVLGVDFTPAMLEKARQNVAKLGYTNVEFRQGDIEAMPVEDNSVDVVISNCVLNLVPDKEKAFSEIHRVLKPGGHLSVSDVVVRGVLPEKLKKAAVLYAGCVSGAMEVNEYLAVMKNSGLQNITIQKEKVISISDELLLAFVSPTELEEFKKTGAELLSVTVYGEKSQPST